MKLLLIISAIQFSLSSFSQLNVPVVRIFLEDIEGRPLKFNEYEGVEGSAFMYEDWNQGSVTFAQGSVLSGVDLKFAIYGSQLFFRKGEEMLEFVMPVKEFTLSPSKSPARTFRAYYPPISGNTGKTFYEVMLDGKFQLLRHTSREVKDHKSYNEPVKKKFFDKETWFVYLPDGNIHFLKKDKESLKALIPSKANEIDKIISEKKLKLKNDADIIELFKALNAE